MAHSSRRRRAASVRNPWVIAALTVLVAFFVLTVAYLRGGAVHARVLRLVLSVTDHGATDIERTRQLAEWGDAAAQQNLGVRYERGRDVTQDYTQAAAWYRKAAEQGVAVAQFNIGRMYYNGQGIAHDDAQAAAWYRKAAEQGIPAAQDYLGYMHRMGRGVPRDDKEAVVWYRKAAEQGRASAQEGLGYMYFAGQGVPRDLVEAYTWQTLATTRAAADTQKSYAETRDALAKQMTPQQIAEAERRASAWLATFGTNRP